VDLGGDQIRAAASNQKFLKKRLIWIESDILCVLFILRVL